MYYEYCYKLSSSDEVMIAHNSVVILEMYAASPHSNIIFKLVNISNQW